VNVSGPGSKSVAADTANQEVDPQITQKTQISKQNCFLFQSVSSV
jgi:hypothetical protein